MTGSQSNYLNMSSAVLTLFDRNPLAWKNTGVVADGVGRLRSTIADITGTATKQGENNPVGHTTAKEHSRDRLEDLVYRTALRVRSYAGIVGDDVLLEKMRFSRSSLDNLGINDLLTRSRIILDACVAHFPALDDYQVDRRFHPIVNNRIPQSVELSGLVDKLLQFVNSVLTRLQNLFAQIRKQLKTLDDLVEGYIEDDEFVATYFNARRIHDLKGRKARTEE
jgi:hypothetical protein